MWPLQVGVVLFSASIILFGDLFWKEILPLQFWKVQVAELTATSKKDLWNLRSVEWSVMRQRLELTIAVSEAGDKAECLGVDCGQFKALAKQEAHMKLEKLMRLEARAKLAYHKTSRMLEEAKRTLASFEAMNR